MAVAAVAVLAAALCLSAGTAPSFSGAAIAATQFTLRWQHSIEKTAWEEDYVVAGSWLLLSGARIQGSGAGMEPPPDAVLQGGVWHYRVADPWRRSLVLARSEFVRDYELCVHDHCQPLSHWIAVAAGTTTLQACAAQLASAAPAPVLTAPARSR